MLVRLPDRKAKAMPVSGARPLLFEGIALPTALFAACLGHAVMKKQLELLELTNLPPK